jgi:cobalamin biosynthesis protein CobT
VGTCEWYVTERLVTNPSIWKKVQTENGQSCYALDDAKVHAWLVRDDGEVIDFDSENNWVCVSCPSSDEKPSEDDQDEVDQDVEDQEGGDRDGEDHHEGAQSGNTHDGDAQDKDAQDRKGRVGEAPAAQGADEEDREEDAEEGGVPLTEAQMAPDSKRKFMLVDFDAGEHEGGYDRDVEKGSVWKKRLNNDVFIDRTWTRVLQR